jgi:hypothetical protein
LPKRSPESGIFWHWRVKKRQYFLTRRIMIYRFDTQMSPQIAGNPFHHLVHCPSQRSIIVAEETWINESGLFLWSIFYGGEDGRFPVSAFLQDAWQFQPWFASQQWNRG